MPNIVEQERGSSPHDADSDDDGLSDGAEVSRVDANDFNRRIELEVQSQVRPWVVSTADLDGDGDPDVLGGSVAFGALDWYENQLDEPAAGFVRRLISYPYVIEAIFPVDLDGDSDLDWYGLARRQRGRLVRDRLDQPSGNPFVYRQISNLGNGVRSVFAADLDGDGDADVIAGSTTDSEVAWYENRLVEPSADFGRSGSSRCRATESGRGGRRSRS